MDNTYSDGIPVSGDVQDVLDYIEPLIPVDSAGYFCLAPVAQTVAFSLTLTPDTPTNRTNTEAELKSTITNEGIVGGTINLSAFQEALSRVPNLTDWNINSINAVAPADVAAAAGYLHTIGAVTYV